MEYRRLFETWEAKEGETFEDGWKNKLIWGDNKYVMSALLEKFAGKIGLIYIDPPFATGADFSFIAEVGDSDVELIKRQSIIEEKAYRDTWGRGIESYLDMIYGRLSLMRDLLSEKGSIYVHCDWHLGQYIKVILDEIFGKDNFRNEIVVRRIRKNVRERTHVPRLNIGFDSILFYSKSNEHLIEPPLKEDPKPERWHSFEAAEIRTGMDYELFGHRPKKGNHWRWSKDRSLKAIEEGTLRPNPNTGKPEYFIAESTHILRDNLWDDITAYSFNYNYPTEKKEDMLQLIIEASSTPKDIVADFFCGSGTTLAVAEKLGRRWIGCDISRYAIHVTRKRLMETENCKPFEVLNLGKYERQVWQGVSFNGNQQTVLYEYLAFILKLYGAEPISGFSNIHGKKGKALVHVGSVDAPITIDEIIAALKESALAGVKELHVLGWEWEMGLHELIEKEAKREDVKLVLKLIPNEAMEAEAVRKGDVRFFDLAYLKANIKNNGNKEAIVELTDFVIPNTELISDEVRDKIKKWSDYVDYWAVDFNFQCDTFINQWTSYRTRQDRTLKLKSDSYTYKKPGKYKILIKVIDIFGIDTSQAFEIQVK